MKTKAIIRKELRQKEDTNLEEKSNIIIEKLKTLPEYKKASHILSYVSKEKEINTQGLLQSLLENKEKKVFVPFISENIIKVSELGSLSELTEGKFGVPEPKNPAETKTTADIVIVPGLAFDSSGNRIGFGMGYYDQFLAGYKAIKIALALEAQLMESLPCEEHDIPVDIIITEDRIIRCNNENRQLH